MPSRVPDAHSAPPAEADELTALRRERDELLVMRSRAEEAEARLRLALSAARFGTWDFAPATGIMRCDDGLLALFGLPPGTTVTRERLLTAVHPDDRERVRAEGDRAFGAADDGTYEVSYRVCSFADGSERWVTARGRTLFDAAGKPARFLGVAVDVTRERAARERLAFLGEASALLASTLDFRTTLARVAQLIVPRSADACVVELASDDGGLEQVAVAHVDPEMKARMRAMRARHPPERGPLSGLYRVLESGQPLFMADVTEAMTESTARDPEHLTYLRALGPRSALLVPLSIGERTIGVLGLFHSVSGRRYGEDDLALAQELSARAALAIENARLFAASQAAIRRRDDFLSIASHELKTPISSLLLTLDSVERDARRSATGDVASDRQLARLGRASVQVRRLTQLVDQLLDVSRLASGRLDLARSAFDLGQLAREVAQRFEEQALASGTALELSLATAVEGSWDRDRLDQVLTNLIANALKYASGQPLRIDVAARGDTVQLTVSDGGPGIALADRERVFERFERSEGARHIGGLGLGLWIVREIVQAHGGTIQVESEPGRGARFVAVLPRWA